MVFFHFGKGTWAANATAANWMIHMPGRKVVTLGRWATISVKHVSGCQGTTFLIHLDSTDGTAQVLDLDLVN